MLVQQLTAWSALPRQYRPREDMDMGGGGGGGGNGGMDMGGGGTPTQFNHSDSFSRFVVLLALIYCGYLLRTVKFDDLRKLKKVPTLAFVAIMAETVVITLTLYQLMPPCLGNLDCNANCWVAMMSFDWIYIGSLGIAYTVRARALMSVDSRKQRLVAFFAAVPICFIIPDALHIVYFSTYRQPLVSMELLMQVYYAGNALLVVNATILEGFIVSAMVNGHFSNRFKQSHAELRRISLMIICIRIAVIIVISCSLSGVDTTQGIVLLLLYVADIHVFFVVNNFISSILRSTANLNVTSASQSKQIQLNEKGSQGTRQLQSTQAMQSTQATQSAAALVSKK